MSILNSTESPTSRWLVIRGVLAERARALTAFPLTTSSLVGLFLFAVLVLIPLYLLITFSYEKERAVRTSLYERDLKEIASRFDADERFVLANNFAEFKTATRPIAPLVLPRPYYLSLPNRASLASPRPPPRNCFVELTRQSVQPLENLSRDRFCAYFVPDPAFGTHLFLAISFSDEDLVIHRIGDSRLSADSFRLEIFLGDEKRTWILTLQEPTAYLIPAKYAVTGYVSDGKVWERDKRLEGWAHAQKDPTTGAQLITVLARLEYSAIDPAFPRRLTELEWPPAAAKAIRLSVSRRDVSAQRPTAPFVRYDNAGISILSLPSLYSSIQGTHASMIVRRIGNPSQEWRMTPLDAEGGNDSWIRFHGGDLILASKKGMNRTYSLPDTDLIFEIVHPGTVIELAVWQATVVLFFVLIIFIALAAFFIFRVLNPIRRMARRADNLARKKQGAGYLPYSEEENEIGVLSNAFNALLSRTREQAQREVEEREKREAARRRTEQEEMRVRETMLKTIGHEIRAPLQALRAVHASGSEGRKHVDRMARAVEQLFGASGPEAGLAGMKVLLERKDLTEFLQGVADNAPQVGVPDVRYSRPSLPLYCQIDENALEDAFVHLLDNANRFRQPSTWIDISLAPENSEALIKVANQGPQIPFDMLDKVFEYGVSLDPKPRRGQLGQGLFVARGNVRKMGGELTAHNTHSGVILEMRLPLVS